MSVHRLLIILAALIVLAAPAAAQHEVGARFGVAAPQGGFADQLDNPGFGVMGHYAYGVNRRVAVGAGLGFLVYGHESRVEQLPPAGEFELVTNNMIAVGHLLGRVDLAAGPVVPYLEGRVGLSLLWTESHIEDADWDDGEIIAENVNASDATSALAWGGGLRILLTEGDYGDPSISLDLKVMSVIGGRAEYLTEGAVEAESDDRVRFRYSETETDHLSYEIGVTWIF